MAAVTMTAAGAAFGHGRILVIVAAALAGVTLVILLVHLTFDFETSAHAHAACSARLWQIRERYRSLLSDLHDGVLDVVEARVRRDKLIDELRAIYEQTPMTHLAEYQAAQRGSDASSEPAFTDEEARLFQPRPFEGTGKTQSKPNPA